MKTNSFFSIIRTTLLMAIMIIAFVLVLNVHAQEANKEVKAPSVSATLVAPAVSPAAEIDFKALFAGKKITIKGARAGGIMVMTFKDDYVFFNWARDKDSGRVVSWEGNKIGIQIRSEIYYSTFVKEGSNIYRIYKGDKDLVISIEES